MRYATAKLLLAWVLLATSGRPEPLPTVQSPQTIIHTGSAWEIPFSEPVVLDNLPPDCALAGSCWQEMQTRLPCKDKSDCMEFSAFLAGQGQPPPAHKFGVDGSHTASATSTSRLILPSATLLLGGALLVPLLLPWRSRRRRR